MALDMDTPTSVLSRRYTLEQEIGRGDCSISWLAHPKKSLEPKLVVKELQLEKLGNLHSLEQFEAEARLLSHLQHPHIPDFVQFISEDTDQGKRLYLVQEYIPGQTLEQHLNAGRPFSEADARRVARELGKVLEYMHGFSPPLLHRDLQPANILLRQSDEQVFLIDFGAVRTPARTGADGLRVPGTYGYMPPEQLAGQAVPASDFYALGMTLIRMLSHTDPVNLPKQGHKADFRPLLNVSPGFARLLDRLIEPDPKRRLNKAADLLAALDRLETPPRQNRWQLSAAIAGGLIVLLGLLWNFERNHKAEAQNAVSPVQSPAPVQSAEASASPAAALPGLSGREALNLANDFYDANQCQSAVKYYTAALAELPDDAEIRFRRGYCYGELREFRLSIQDYLQAQKLNPKVHPETTEHNLGYNNYMIDDYEAARRHLLAQLSIDPEHVSALNYLGLVYTETRKYDQALEVFQRGMALDPKYRYLYNNRGRLWHDQGKLEQALLDYDKAIALAPGYALPYYNKAELHYDQGRYLLCISDATRAIELSSPYASAHNMRGLCHHSLKQLPQAIADYKQAIALKRAYPSAHYNLGLAYDDNSDLTRASEAYTRALDLQPDYDKPLNNLGYIHERQGRYDQALSFYTRAVEARPDPLYYYNRGNLYRHLKNCPLAISDWKIACSKGNGGACRSHCP